MRENGGFRAEKRIIVGGIIGYKWSFMKSCECFIGSGWENLCGDDVVLGLTGASGLTPRPFGSTPFQGVVGPAGENVKPPTPLGPWLLAPWVLGDQGSLRLPFLHILYVLYIRYSSVVWHELCMQFATHFYTKARTVFTTLKNFLEKA